MRGLAGGPDAFEAVQLAVGDEDFAVFIIAPLPKPRSRCRRRVLVHGDRRARKYAP